MELPWRTHEPLPLPENIGFGLAPEPASEGQYIDGVSFYWPLDDDSPNRGIVIGDLTQERRAEVEARARDWLRSFAPAGTTDLIWRVLPTWESFRDFEHNEICHTFRMRGFLASRPVMVNV